MLPPKEIKVTDFIVNFYSCAHSVVDMFSCNLLVALFFAIRVHYIPEALNYGKLNV